jgi:hypothetical protein
MRKVGSDTFFLFNQSIFFLPQCGTEVIRVVTIRRNGREPRVNAFSGRMSHIPTNTDISLRIGKILFSSNDILEINSNVKSCTEAPELD